MPRDRAAYDLGDPLDLVRAELGRALLDNAGRHQKGFDRLAHCPRPESDRLFGRGASRLEMFARVVWHLVFVVYDLDDRGICLFVRRDLVDDAEQNRHNASDLLVDISFV